MPGWSLGGSWRRWGWRAATAAISIPVSIFLAGTFIPPPTRRRAEIEAVLLPTATFCAVLHDRRTRWLLVMLGLNLGLYMGWFIDFGAYATGAFAVSAGLLIANFSFSGFTELAANTHTPPLLRRFAATRVAYVTLGATGAALLLTGIAITSVPGILIAAIVVLNRSAAAYAACVALLLSGSHPRPGAAMALASAGTGIGSAFCRFVTGWALALTGSHDGAYRVLGLLAPVAMAALWLATRTPEDAPVIVHASSPI